MELEKGARVSFRSDHYLAVQLDDLPWVVLVRLAIVDGVPQIISLRLEPPTDETGHLVGDLTVNDLIVSAERLRSLPIKRIKDAAMAVRNAGREGPGVAVRVEREPGKQWDDEHYRLVARVYEEAAERGAPPLKAIQARWGVQRSMAARYAQRARAKGFLKAPRKPGVVGTGRDELLEAGEDAGRA